MVSTKIVYDSGVPGQGSLARDIKRVLLDASREYEVTECGVSSPAEMTSFLTGTSPENCQLVINIDLTGYGNETTAGVASINRLPMDIVNVIMGTCEEYDAVLKKTQSYMSRFVFMSEGEYRRAVVRYPHLWHVEYIGDIDRIVKYIDEIEMRY